LPTLTELGPKVNHYFFKLIVLLVRMV